jgi:hypothetical protein
MNILELIIFIRSGIFLQFIVNLLRNGETRGF